MIAQKTKHDALVLADQQKSLHTAGQAAARIRFVKLLCMIVIGVCFWYAVPYRLPLQLDPNPIAAASSEADAFQGNVSRQIALPVLFVASVFGLYRLPKRGQLPNGKLLICAFAYLGWAIASTVWSIDPAITRKRLVVFLINATVAYALARLASTLELAWLGFACTGTVALLALWADVVLLHAFKPMDPDYRFMGVMTANYQAMNLFVCLVCGLTLLQSRPRTQWIVPLLALFAALLFLTRARIGTILFVAVFVFVSMSMAKQRLSPPNRALLFVGLLAVLVPSGIFLAGRNGQSALTSLFMMGRQDTESTASLSNRAPLWTELLADVYQRPILGAGFEAFWSPERVEKVSLDQGWVVPHAHNTYLDQTLSLGMVGAGLFTGTILGSCFVAWRRYRRQRTGLTLMPALLVSWLVLLSFTESIPVAPYLPTLLAYSCVLKMCMRENTQVSEAGRVASSTPAAFPASTGLREGQVLA